MTPRWHIGLALVGSLGVLSVIGFSLGSDAADKRRSQLAAEGRSAETRHGSIQYASWGEGPPVLVIHGAGGGFDQGRLLAKAVAGEGFRFIAVSRFGYLGSAMPPDPSTASQAEALHDLLARLGLERVSIIAMSGGVPPALKLAEMFPERTEKLVLLSSAPFTPFSPNVEDRPIPTWAYSALMGNDAVYWSLTKVAPRQLRRAFDARAELLNGLPPDEIVFVDRLVDDFLPATDRLAGIENEAAAVDPEATYDLEAISAPTLVVHARDDRLNPFSIAESIAGRLPNSELIAFENGGHLLLSHHSSLREKVDQFLGCKSERQILSARRL